MFLSDAHVTGLQDRVQRKIAELRSTPSSSDKSLAFFVRSIETVGAAGVMGYMNAKHAKPTRNAMELFGLPIDVALGVLGNVFAVSNYLGEYSEHLHNVSSGILCAYAVRMGMMWGADAKAIRVAQAAQSARTSAGALPPHQSNVTPFGRSGQGREEYDWARPSRQAA